MSCELVALTIDAANPADLARFWSGLLGWDLAGSDLARSTGPVVAPRDGVGLELRFEATQEAKSVANQMHFDLTSTSVADQQATVARALDLGGRHIDVGQRPEEGHVVLADPEGNELCVIEPGNTFLAGTGFVGALAGDGTQAVGYFWSAVLGWPLVWDQDEETAIQSPHGGSKITWGGPPLAPRARRNRWRFDLSVSPTGDLTTEVERLIGLGARRTSQGQTPLDSAEMVDPDGNEFRLALARIDDEEPDLTLPRPRR